MAYEVRECFHWAREGFSSRAIHIVEHEGFDRVSSGFRIYRDGKAIFTSIVPFTSRDAAEARIAQLVEA